MNYKNIKQRILLIIQEYPEAANDDTLLFVKYWERFDGWSDRSTLYENLRRATNPETLTRRRRELVEAGLVNVSTEATKRRQKAFNNELEAHSNNNVVTAAVGWLKD